MGPKGVAVDRNGHIIVVDNKACCVFIFQSNGKLVTKFGSRGTAERQFAGTSHSRAVLLTTCSSMHVHPRVSIPMCPSPHVHPHVSITMCLSPCAPHHVPLTMCSSVCALGSPGQHQGTGQGQGLQLGSGSKFEL